MEDESPGQLIMPMADENDRASALEAAFNENAIQVVRQKAAPETHPDFDGKHCVECGEGIPQVRLTNGRVRCVVCQNILEKRQKLRR